MNSPRKAERDSKTGVAPVWKPAVRSASASWFSAARASRPSRRRLRLLWLLVIGHWLFRPMSAPADDIPPFAPPLPEVAPAFWEQHGPLALAVSVAAAALLALVLWLALRPKPAPPEPPGRRVRRELAALLGQAETGAALSRVSQSLRRYLAAVFSLPPHELTTTEFCAALSDCPPAGAGLASEICGFLRECDERKFAPGAAPAPLDAARRALELAEKAEARLARLPSPSSPPAGGAPPARS